MKIARLRLTSNRKRSDKSDAVAETEKCQPAQLGQRGDLKQLKVKSLSALLGQICDRKEFCLPFLRGCLLFFFFSSRFLICARTPKIFLVHYSISGKYDYISHSIPAINRNDRQLKFKKKVQITSHMDQIHDERHSYPGRISRSSSRNRFPDDHETDTLVVRCTRRLTIRLRFNQQGVGCRTGAQS